MNAVSKRIIVRAAILAGLCAAAIWAFKLELGVDLHGIPPGFLYLFFVFLPFLVWFLVCEPWRQPLRRATIVRPALFVLFLALGVLFDLAAHRMRHSFPRGHIANDLKQISLALLEYQEKNGSFPPAIVRNPEGKPLYSWRVLILPFLEQEKLYSQFHLDEPWDSPNNIQFVEQMPKIYAGPEEVAVGLGRTFYQVFIGAGAAFESEKKFKSPEDFPDGVDTTILVAEARRPVIWTQPVDLPFYSNGALSEIGAPRGNAAPTLFVAAMVDGHVRSLKVDVPADALRPWITRNARDTPPNIEP